MEAAQIGVQWRIGMDPLLLPHLYEGQKLCRRPSHRMSSAPLVTGRIGTCPQPARPWLHCMARIYLANADLKGQDLQGMIRALWRPSSPLCRPSEEELTERRLTKLFFSRMNKLYNTNLSQVTKRLVMWAMISGSA